MHRSARPVGFLAAAAGKSARSKEEKGEGGGFRDCVKSESLKGESEVGRDEDLPLGRNISKDDMDWI